MMTITSYLEKIFDRSAYMTLFEIQYFYKFHLQEGKPPPPPPPPALKQQSAGAPSGPSGPVSPAEPGGPASPWGPIIA